MIKKQLYPSPLLCALFMIALCLIESATAQISTKSLLSKAGSRIGNNSSTCPAMSGDGRYTIFESFASNLVPNDTNNRSDLFLYDSAADSISRISQTAAGTQQSGGENPVTCSASISRDGSTIVYATDGTGLVPEASTQVSRIYAIDRASGAIELLVPAALTEGAYFPVVSADGSKVVFVSNDPALSPTGSTLFHAYLIDRNLDTRTLLSVDQNGDPANNDTFRATISANGQYAAYESTATNLKGAVTSPASETTQIFLVNLSTGEHSLVSRNQQGTMANADAFAPSISADGSKIVFFSEASNLTSSDTNTDSDIFVADRDSGAIELVSISPKGDQIRGFSELFINAISADGNLVMFRSLDTSRRAFGFEVFVRDRANAQTYLATFSKSCGSKKSLTDLNAGALAPDANLIALSSGREFPKAELQLFSIGLDVLRSISAVPTDLGKIDSDVCKSAVTLGATPFSLASSATLPASILAADQTPGVKYETRIRRAGSKTDLRRIISKRNVIALSNLKPGNYEASYRVRLTTSSGATSVSDFSARSAFQIR